MDATELTAIDDTLRRQWLRLRTWISGLDDDALHRASVLDGWTVEHLVAHLGRSLDALAAVQPAAAGPRPLSLGEYLATYTAAGADIDRITRELAAAIAPDRAGRLDAMAATAFAQVTQLRTAAPDVVVQARRGAIHLSDFLLSRLLELVVHGDDLARSLDRTSTGEEGPVDPAALRLVADSLLEVVVDRGGWDLEVVDPLAWTRLACGRVPHDADGVARALSAHHTSDSVPDLGRTLPLL